MTNEEKARVLSNKGCLGAYISRDAEALYPTEEVRKRLSIYGACLEAMQWKDEQEIEFLQSLMFQSASYHIFDRINERIKLLKGE